MYRVRHSLNCVSWKTRPEVAADLKLICKLATVDDAERQRAAFEQKWDDAYPPIARSWRRNWMRITPFFDPPPEILKMIYVTSANESVNMSLEDDHQELGPVFLVTRGC